MMPRPLAPKLERMLADRARKIERREVAKRGYRAADGRAASDVGNVIALKPNGRVLPAPPPPPPLSMHPIEVRNAEALLTEATNEALIEGMREMTAIIRDPYVKDAVKLQAMGILVKAKESISRSHLRAQRHAAYDADAPHLSREQRTAFEREMAALRLVADGYTVVDRNGRTVTPRARTSMPVEDDAPDPLPTPKQRAADDNLRQQVARADARWGRAQ
jgi:hypothetical protein